MAPLNNYDIIARRYDFLSRLVFGRAQVHAQTDLLSLLKPGSRLLIVGGGTGWILDELAGFHITYVELSEQMLALARKRGSDTNHITFVQAPIEAFATGAPQPPAAQADPQRPPSPCYDAILTGFLFDNFSPTRAASVFHLLDGLLEPGGAWLFTDFYYRKGSGVWQGLLMKTMYTFFRVLCHVEARRMPDMGPFFKDSGYAVDREGFYYGGLIQSVGYRKITGA